MATVASQRPRPPPPTEVLCAGCSETLEIDPGLTEFICPDCHTPQALPPELMPRKKKALPLPRGVDSSKIQLPCGSCATLLNVPHGLARFSCPRCGVELAVDQERLKGYLAGASVEAEDVAFVMPSAVRLPQAVDVEPTTQTQTQTYVTTPRAPRPRFSYVDSEIQNATPVSSRGLVSSSNNRFSTDNNIHKNIPASMTPVPCRLNTQQTEHESEEREEPAPTPPLTKKAVSKENKKNKKRSSGPTTKELELSLRRSKRIAELTPPSKKNKKSQSQPNETPLDIARHYNGLFPLDNDPESPIRNSGSQVRSPGSQIPDLNPQGREINNSDDEEGGDDVAESDSSQSEAEPDWRRKPEPESVLKKALMNAQKRRGLIFGSSKKTKKTPGKRGPSKCLEIWGRSEDDRAEIEFNNAGQAVGDLSCAFGNFLGSIARDGKLVPINYTEWKAVPAKFKDIVWYIIKSKCIVQEEHKSKIIQTVGRHWVHWKARLKRKHYDTHDNDEARLADFDSRIEADQWPFLVEFWGSDEGKKRSKASKALRAKQRTYHTSGTKSFARLREEERLKRKEEPSRAEMFILTHTRKDGTPIDEESAQIISRLRQELAKASPSSSSSKTRQNDILAKVLGKRRHINSYGILPSRPPNDSDEQMQDSDVQDLIVREAKKLAEEESRPMKEQMKAMERRHKEMEMEMQIMRQAIALSGIVPPGCGAGNLQVVNGERVAPDPAGSSSR